MVSFPGVKRPGRGVNHPPPSSAEVKERVEFHFYFSSVPSWLVIGQPLPFTNHYTYLRPIPVAERSNARVYGRSLAGSNPAWGRGGAWMSVSCECCVFSGRGLCDGPIPSPEESYRLWCVIVFGVEISSMRRPWPALGCSARNKETHI